jgi:hypothetical protein
LGKPGCGYENNNSYHHRFSEFKNASNLAGALTIENPETALIYQLSRIGMTT